MDERVSVAMETNGKGCIGFLVQLPGAYVRAPTEKECLSKVQAEVRSYMRWLGLKPPPRVRTAVVQWHQSSLPVEDADSEVLLDADRRKLRREEFDLLTALARHSGKTFVKLYSKVRLKRWVDMDRDRPTFYGRCPRSVQEVYEHVDSSQHYYLSRMNVHTPQGGDFMAVRELCLNRFRLSFVEGTSNMVFRMDEELWTIRKVMRRLIWHDRIHAKAIVRILEKQRRLGLIDGYEDPFKFSKPSLKASTRSSGR